MNTRELEMSIQDLFEGRLSADEVKQLEQELVENPEAREIYKSYARLEGAMSYCAAGVDPARIVSMDQVVARGQRRQFRVAMLSAAAVLMGGMLVLSLVLGQDYEPTLTLKVSQGSEFAISHAPADEATPKGMVLEPGSRLQLRRGAVELTFSTGVRSIVQAPADMRLLDENSLQLNRGKGWFEVPPEASGFRVVTPNITLNDIGTKFGIISQPNDGRAFFSISASSLIVDWEFDNLIAFNEWGVPFGERRFGVGPESVHAFPAAGRFPFVVRMVHVVGVGDAEVGIEAVGHWENFGVMAEVPFSEAAGGVALGFQVIGDGVLGRVEAFIGGGEQDVLVHANAFRVATGEQRGAGGGADWRGDHEAGELPAIGREAIDARGLDRFGAEAAQVAVALVVDEDQDEVRLGRVSGGPCECGDEKVERDGSDHGDGS